MGICKVANDPPGYPGWDALAWNHRPPVQSILEGGSPCIQSGRSTLWWGWVLLSGAASWPVTGALWKAGRNYKHIHSFGLTFDVATITSEFKGCSLWWAKRSGQILGPTSQLPPDWKIDHAQPRMVLSGQDCQHRLQQRQYEQVLTSFDWVTINKLSTGQLKLGLQWNTVGREVGNNVDLKSVRHSLWDGWPGTG